MRRRSCAAGHNVQHVQDRRALPTPSLDLPAVTHAHIPEPSLSSCSSPVAPWRARRTPRTASWPPYSHGRHRPHPLHHWQCAPPPPPPRPPSRARRTAGIAAKAPMTGTAARRAVPQSCPRQCPRSYSRPHSAWSSFPLLRWRLQAAHRHVRPPLLAAALPAARPRRGPELGTPACPRRPRPGCARRCGGWSARRGGAP